MSTAHHTPDVITVFGRNLVDDLIGQLGFTEMIGLVMTQGTPLPPSHLEVIDALLVTFTDHGVTPSSMAARLTFLGAPEAMQGAVAAGISGAGSRFLGTLENSARDLSAVVAAEPNAEPAQRARVLVESARPGGGASASGPRSTRSRTPASRNCSRSHPTTRSPDRAWQCCWRCRRRWRRRPDACCRSTGQGLPALCWLTWGTPRHSLAASRLSREPQAWLGSSSTMEMDGQARSLWDRERRRAASNADEEGQG